MRRRTRRWAVGAMAAVVAAVVLPAVAIGAGPVRIADGEPDNDMQLSVLSPTEAAFVQKKLAMAAAASSGARASTTKSSGRAIARFACEHDPCEGDPNPSAWPPPTGPSLSKTLGTKARQQINNYFCGPASGQIVINWSRGITSGTTNGEDATTNWRKQSKIAEWMKTTSLGTGGANLAVGLNNPSAVLKPDPDWIYVYADIGTMQEFFGKIVTDIDGFSMPLVLATAPHLVGEEVNHLVSWPTVAPGAHHWIVIRGYDGLWGGSTPIIIKYQDSSSGYGGSTGSFSDALSVVWNVSRLNQGGHVVW